MKLDKIIAGWKNMFFPTPEIEKEAIKRISICLDCNKLSKTNTCKICRCYMPAKVRSPNSTCPLNKWD